MVRKCPKCGKTYTGYPALSRIDNVTQICPDCGVREAMAYMGVSREETERIVDKIHSYNDENAPLKK